MSVRTFQELLPHVQENLPACPTPTILSHIRKAAIRVCEHTLMWRHVESPYTLVPGVHEYPYQKPQGSDVHVVFSATINDYPLQLVTLDNALTKFPAWAELYSGLSPEEIWSSTPSASLNAFVFNDGVYNDNPEFVPNPDMYVDGGHPTHFTQVTPDKYVVLPQPNDDQDYVLKLIYALRPKRNATSLPTYVMDELEDVIVHAALQSLFALPGNPWTDRDMTVYHGRQARYQMSERRARANLGNQRGSMQVKLGEWV